MAAPPPKRPLVKSGSITDTIAVKAAVKQGQIRSTRQRVCRACVTQNDQALGLIHSDLPCARCGVAPCYGIMTAGTFDARVS